MDWNPTGAEQLGEACSHIFMTKPPRYGTAGYSRVYSLMTFRIRNARAFVRSLHCKFIAPDMSRERGLQPQARSAVQPQPAPLGLFGGHFQAFLAPQPFYSLVVDAPAARLQQVRDASIALATVLLSQCHYPQPEAPCVVGFPAHIALNREAI